MAIQLRTTLGAKTHGVKMLVYGAAGSGKTTLIGTLPNPVILSAEAGLLSLSGKDIPFLTIDSMETLTEAYKWLTESDEGKSFESIAIDSLSEIAEVVLSAEKKVNKDPRAAYGALQDTMGDMIRAFRDIPERNVYFSAKVEKATDESGRMMFAPMMPGNKLGQMLPFFFDEVLALRVEKDAEGNNVRALMCDSDGLWTAKDRSGKLGMWESPDLGAIIAKVKA